MNRIFVGRQEEQVILKKAITEFCQSFEFSINSENTENYLMLADIIPLPSVIVVFLYKINSILL